jgi:methylmalonyl-CoA/ethylmalonyl-CoA epimerase
MTPTNARGTRIAHIGIAVDALDALLPFYRDILGLPVVPLADADGARIIGLAADDTLVELLHSDQPGTPVEKFLRTRGPGVHHVCFGVDDLEGTLARCRAAGLRLIDEVPRMGAEGKRIAFLHPRSTGGTLVELTEN